MASNCGLQGTEDRLWTLYHLGLLFVNEGKLDSARFIFNGVLEENPYYAYAFCGLGDIEAAKGNYSKALDLYVKASKIIPDHIFLEKIADLYRIMNLPEIERKFVKQVLDAFIQHEKDGYNVDLEYTRFCLNHEVNSPEIIIRAEREYRRRKGNIDAGQTYAQVLLKYGKYNEAAKIIEESMRLGTKRASLHYTAAAIYLSLHDIDNTKNYIQLAFNDNPYIDLLSLNDAKMIYSSVQNITSVN